MESCKKCCAKKCQKRTKKNAAVVAAKLVLLGAIVAGVYLYRDEIVEAGKNIRG